MIHSCEFASGNLLGKSYLDDSVDSLLNGEFYDLVIVVSSWEDRVLSIVEANGLRADNSVLVLYHEVDAEGLRIKNDQLLAQYLNDNTSSYSPLQSSATDLDGTWKLLFNLLGEVYNQVQRPLRVLLDASTCQRYHILALMANGFEYGLVRKISIIYAEGEYPEKPQYEELVFGDGTWRSVAVPGLEGEYSPGKDLLYYVSVGFEGHKTLRVVARGDPDRVALLFPDPGTKLGYAERTRRANAALIEEYGIGAELITKAPAGDAISAWSALSARDLERPADENEVYLLNGTKPHSIAMGLRAITRRSPAVLYSIPEAYRVVNIRPTGVFWRFDIECRTVLI